MQASSLALSTQIPLCSGGEGEEKRRRRRRRREAAAFVEAEVVKEGQWKTSD